MLDFSEQIKIQDLDKDSFRIKVNFKIDNWGDFEVYYDGILVFHIDHKDGEINLTNLSSSQYKELRNKGASMDSYTEGFIGHNLVW